MNATMRLAMLRLRMRSISDDVLNLSDVGCANTSNLARVLALDCKTAGVRRIRFHDLRHTYATNFVANGGSIHELSKILGHSTTAMTSKYAHFSTAQATKAASIVNFDLPSETNVVRIANGHGSDLSFISI